MSKSKQVASSAETTDNKQKPAGLSNAQSFLNKLKAIAKKRGVALGILAAAVAMWHFAPNVITGSTAILYLFAMDGKISGRLQGNVLMRNGRGRAFVVPALVRNAYTTLIRMVFTSLSKSFGSVLDDSERDSFNNITWYFKSDRFGQSKQVKGKQAYIGLNMNLAQIGGTPITIAPPIGGTVFMNSDTSGVANTTTNLLELAGSFAVIDADVTVNVLATQVLPAGISRPKPSAFRSIGYQLDNLSSSPSSVKSAYEAKFGNTWDDALMSGNNIWFQLTPINIKTGAAGASQIIKVEISV